VTLRDLAALRSLCRFVEHEVEERLDRAPRGDDRLVISDARHLREAAGSLRERLDEMLAVVDPAASA
jgi:hypothetical protein